MLVFYASELHSLSLCPAASMCTSSASTLAGWALLGLCTLATAVEGLALQTPVNFCVTYSEGRVNPLQNVAPEWASHSGLTKPLGACLWAKLILNHDAV